MLALVLLLAGILPVVDSNGYSDIVVKRVRSVVLV